MDLCYYAPLLVLLLCIEKSYGKINYVTFPRVQTRATVYVPKLINKVCLLEPQEGPCRGNIDMFYFDPPKKNCSVFKWGGCQGNGNRFDTLQDCRDTCLSQPGRKVRPNYCSLRWDFGYCFGEDPRWFYDQKWQICKKSIYSGCGGNKNNFYSLEMDCGLRQVYKSLEKAIECEAVCKYGNGPITPPTKDPPRHKAIIINPGDTTRARGLDQPTDPPTTTKRSNVTC